MAKEIIELDTAEAWKSETYTEDIENSMINEYVIEACVHVHSEVFKTIF